MPAAAETHVLSYLIQISERAKNRAVRIVVSGIQPVIEGDADLGVVAGREEGRAADIPELSRGGEPRRDRPREPHGGISLVVKKLHRERGIDRRLVRIVDRPIHLVQAEPPGERGLCSESVVYPD